MKQKDYAADACFTEQWMQMADQDARSTGLMMSPKTGITVKTVMSCAAYKGGDEQCNT